MAQQRELYTRSYQPRVTIQCRWRTSIKAALQNVVEHYEYRAKQYDPRVQVSRGRSVWEITWNNEVHPVIRQPGQGTNSVTSLFKLTFVINATCRHVVTYSSAAFTIPSSSSRICKSRVQQRATNLSFKDLVNLRNDESIIPLATEN